VAAAAAVTWIANPYLHYAADRIYNPLTDSAITVGEQLFTQLRTFLEGAPDADVDALAEQGWIVERGTDLSTRHRLKIVSLETTTTCNQKCYFCPVSVAPREDAEMSVEMFEQIVGQLQGFRDTLEGVFLQSYNEPTVDRRFVDFCKTLFNAGIPVAVLSNGSGLTPAKVDALSAAGRLRYLCINLSTLDAEEYKHDRGADHLPAVLRNLDHFRNQQIADQMRIIVLGRGDAAHQRSYEAVRDRFAGSLFEVEHFLTIDRGAWNLDVAMKTIETKKHLAGCDLLGSRPIQHLHITPRGACILCCQDYDENYVVGDLTRQTVRQVLEGPELARMRRWTYGTEEAPDDFICRTCVWALER